MSSEEHAWVDIDAAGGPRFCGRVGERVRTSHFDAMQALFRFRNEKGLSKAVPSYPQRAARLGLG